tara:strand:- start:2787 stop:3110 length:324 start_codon:yes stop_codon:yes gene_type:complete
MENREEKELNNTSSEVVDVWITLDNGDELRVYKKADPVQMENQEEKETSLKYYESKVSLFIIHNRSIDAGFLIDAFEEAKKMYEIEIAKAYEKGYQDAIKFYNQFEK